MSAMPSMGGNGKMRLGLRACAAAGVVAALLMCGACAADAGFDAEVNKDLAKTTCQNAVKKGLKSPASATFDGETVTASGASSWTVAGSVDSQNGFGAMLRARYTCTATLDGDTMRARVTSLG